MWRRNQNWWTFCISAQLLTTSTSFEKRWRRLIHDSFSQMLLELQKHTECRMQQRFLPLLLISTNNVPRSHHIANVDNKGDWEPDYKAHGLSYHQLMEIISQHAWFIKGQPGVLVKLHDSINSPHRPTLDVKSSHHYLIHISFAVHACKLSQKSFHHIH